MNDVVERVSGETYFFRDHGQFDLLRLRLLPELIERRRVSQTLSLWSAGCASGEEAYSLAMLVDMLLPRPEGWRILILGSDIDETALAKARNGRYGQWSFRMVPPALKQRYFRSVGDEWVLDERIRSMVSFRVCDLVGEPFPSGALANMDLILCRNVFIYFGVETVHAVAGKLGAALSEGGYLMTGHTELIGHQLRNLQRRLFVEGVVHQKLAQAPAVCEDVRSVSIMSRLASPPLQNPAKPVALVSPMLAPSVEELLAAAHELADRGEYAQSEQICRRALAIEPLAHGPHFLLAQLAQLRGDFAQAEKLLDKTLYLDPRNVAAHLELAALCERAENLPRAQTLRRAALDIIRTLPGDTVIEPYETSAAEVAQWIAQ